ncbi:phosphotransferase family protein [Streptodolium elevatio]|uniref:Phosphotransferase family protein n=1 Tax=Streptodolium elevatio TaxID=3157996 RepID=A0ABV3DAA9_9ACTN
MSEQSGAMARPRTSTRDTGEAQAAVRAWLRTRVPDPDAEVLDLAVPSANGMSSETLLLTARWTENGGPVERRLVVRLAPRVDAMPVFPRYDLAAQFESMRLVRDHVPVPDVHWYEPDPAPLGSPFFVMERLDGRVPPDIPPYVYGSWVTELSPQARSRMQDATVEAIAALHRIPDAPSRFAFLDREPSNGRSTLRRHVDATRAFADWAAAEHPSPLIDRGFAWLDANWPTEEGPTVLSWGDSRVGNIMYTEGADALPAAVLDWEMAALGVPELDLAWLVDLHRMFQTGAERRGVPGLPDFLRWDDVAARYAELTGYHPRDEEFHRVYASLRMSVISLRTQLRAVHFGEIAMPDDPDDLIRARCDLEDLITA